MTSSCRPGPSIKPTAQIPDSYTNIPELHGILRHNLGTFPLFHFWGPAADIRSSRWIAEAAWLISHKLLPTLSLVYLPHLDYGLQKLGPTHPDITQRVEEIDSVVGDLIDRYTAHQIKVLLVSEYGIEPTAQSDAGIAVNRVLREAGLLAVRTEDGGELLDAGASQAFCVADHQVAHVYHQADLNLPLPLVGYPEPVPWSAERIGSLLRGIDGVAAVHSGGGPRAGDWVLEAKPGRWFVYDYWPADQPERAPDFARTVDIHRKPGYDPRELFLDPTLRFPKLAVGWRLLKKKAGFRQLMDLIPLDASLVRGTHGRVDLPTDAGPLLIGVGDVRPHDQTALPCTEVKRVMLEQLGLAQPPAE